MNDELAQALGQYLLCLATVQKENMFHCTHVMPNWPRHIFTKPGAAGVSPFEYGPLVAAKFPTQIVYNASGWYTVTP